MTRETAKQLWPIIKAWAEGETLQFKRSDGGFFDVEDVVFSEDASCYRIKPKPREYWVNVYSGNVSFFTYPTKEEADKHADINRLECIRVVEAL